MLNSGKEQELLSELRSAEKSSDAAAIESAVASLALYYSVTDQFLAAAPFWRRGAELLARTAADSCELGTYLHNMAVMCLIPAGLRDEARTTLKRSSEIYGLHLRPDARPLCEVNQLLDEIST